MQNWVPQKVVGSRKTKSWQKMYVPNWLSPIDYRKPKNVRPQLAKKNVRPQLAKNVRPQLARPQVVQKCTSPSGSEFYFLDIDGVLLYDLVS